MEWIEAYISTTSEGVEPVLGVLLNCGINGAQIVCDSEMNAFLKENPYLWDYVDDQLTAGYDENAYVFFYVTPDVAGQETLRLIKDHLRLMDEVDIGLPLGDLSVHIKKVDDETWLNEWKKYYKPFKIGNSVVVKPVWEPYTALPGDVVFSINPGSVFGTGLHQSTKLCAAALEEFMRPGMAVLDIGCGSGILFIIALLLGADYAAACDYEPAAAISAEENARLNHIDSSRYAVRTCDIFKDNNLQALFGARRYDIIIANIVADVVIGLSPLAVPLLSPGGVFITSGIIAERVDDVRESLVSNGYVEIASYESGGWYCLAWRQDERNA